MARRSLPSTAVIDPPAATESTWTLPSTEVLADRALGLDPTESDESWEARVLAACSPGRVIYGVRD